MKRSFSAILLVPGMVQGQSLPPFGTLWAPSYGPPAPLTPTYPQIPKFPTPSPSLYYVPQVESPFSPGSMMMFPTPYPSTGSLPLRPFVPPFGEDQFQPQFRPTLLSQLPPLANPIGDLPLQPFQTSFIEEAIQGASFLPPESEDGFKEPGDENEDEEDEDEPDHDDEEEDYDWDNPWQRRLLKSLRSNQ